MLGRFNIAMPENIHDMMEQNFVQSNSSVKLSKTARVPALASLKSKLESFLEPISSCLETLSFFEVFSEESNLFFKYVSYFHNKKQEEASRQSQSSISEGFIPIQSPAHLLMEESTSTKLSLLKEAVLLVEDIIKKLVDGSVTYAEVTLNERLSFTQSNIKSLFDPMEQFAKFKKFGLIKKETLDGIKSIHDLNEIAQQVMTMNDVLMQFDLKGCLQDREFPSLLEIIQSIQKKETSADISIKTANTYLQCISRTLNLDSHNGKQCLKLFSTIKESRPFYQFAVDKGFAGENGLRTFNEQCLFVSSHLEQEDYDMVVFSNLRGAMNVMMPFFDKNCNLRELMNKLTALHTVCNIHEGIQQLKTVNANMEMIKVWFHEAEVK